jgi:hypothetical protein
VECETAPPGISARLRDVARKRPQSLIGGLCEHPFVGSRTYDFARFRRALDRGNVTEALSAANALPHVGLVEALGCAKPCWLDSVVMLGLRIAFTVAVMAVVVWLLLTGKPLGALLIVPLLAIWVRRAAESGRLHRFSRYFAKPS